MSAADIGGMALNGAALTGFAAFVASWFRRGGTWSARLLSLAVACAAVATAALVWALVTLDLSLAAVAAGTNRSSPWYYRVAGLWGGMEGSLLWWSTLLGGLGMAAALSLRRRGEAELARIATTFLAGVFMVFVTIDALFANPFEVLDIPSLDGLGLVPILRHPAMLYHPTIVYCGLVALAVPAALITTWLLAGDGDADCLAPSIQRWLVSSWLLLTAGMLAGAHWAYGELGWGGFWAWDPVENGVLLPWLAVTATLHLQWAYRDRPRPARLAVSVYAAFGLACIGALVTRSGAVESVHAFAVARRVGVALLLAMVTGAVVLAVALRRARARTLTEPQTERASFIIKINSVLAAAALAVILCGTLSPLLSRAITGSRIAVDPHFYSVFVTPIAMAALVLSTIGPTVAHGRSVEWTQALRAPVVLGVAAALVTIVAGAHRPLLLVTFVLAVISVVLGGRSIRRAPVATVAHIGFAVFLVGVIGSSSGVSRQVLLQPGGSAVVAGWHLTLQGVTAETVDDHTAVRADVTARRGDRAVHLSPGINDYGTSTPALPIVALSSSPRDDIKIAMRSVADRGEAVDLDVSVLPLVWWVWWGGLLIVAAGAIKLAQSFSVATPGTPVATGVAGPALPLVEQLGEGGDVLGLGVGDRRTPAASAALPFGDNSRSASDGRLDVRSGSGTGHPTTPASSAEGRHHPLRDAPHTG